MEALQQPLSAVNVKGSLAPSLHSMTPSAHVSVRSLGSSMFYGNTGLRAKVQERLAGGGNNASRSSVVAMAKSAATGYASALADVGQDQKILDSIYTDVERLGKLLEDAQFWKFLTSPVVRDDDKKSIVKELSKDANLQPATVNLLNLMIDRNRTSVLKEVVKEFEELYNQRTDTQVALVTSAVEIDKSQLSLIGKKVQSMSGSKNVKLKNIIDPSIIAGFIVRFGKDGSRLIDMSVKGQLDRITTQIDLADKAAAF